MSVKAYPSGPNRWRIRDASLGGRLAFLGTVKRTTQTMGQSTAAIYTAYTIQGQRVGAAHTLPRAAALLDQ